jgi:hypothetical protein
VQDHFGHGRISPFEFSGRESWHPCFRAQSLRTYCYPGQLPFGPPDVNLVIMVEIAPGKTMTETYDFLAAAAGGTLLQTRDRRAVRIDRVAAADGLIFGEVPMLGPCCWRADGRYKDAPFGASGPLDLMPPGSGPAAGQPRASLQDALEAGEGRPFCCD